MKPFTSLLRFLLAALLTTGGAHAATVTWDGGGGDNNWHNPLNCVGNPGLAIVVPQSTTSHL